MLTHRHIPDPGCHIGSEHGTDILHGENFFFFGGKKFVHLF